MSFDVGGFNNVRNKKQANSINKSERELDCGTAVSELEEKKNDVADLTNFQTEQKIDKVPKAKALNDSHNQNETCELRLIQTEENLMYSYNKTFLSSEDTFTWRIANFLKLPMTEGYFIDSAQFSFANTTWCLRMYPNGKKENHEGWVHLLLVQLQSNNSRCQIYYRLGLKIQDKGLHESLTHMITLHGNMSEVGIINPLQRSDVVTHLKKYAHNSCLVAFCEIKKVELSQSTNSFETPSEYQTEELAEHIQKLCLPLAISPKDIFTWEIKKFFELPMDKGYFIDSETFCIANAVWCLRIYPNGQNNLNHGWIHLLLIRLHSSSSQQCIQYRLGLKMKGNKEYGTLTHVFTFHENAEETGVVNLIKRSDIGSMRKKFARNGVLRVFCQVSNPTVDVTNKTIQLESTSEISSVKKLENSSVGVLEKIPFLGAKDVIWKIPSFVIEPMQVGYWMDSPAFSFLNENWCLRLYVKKIKLGKFWKIYMYLVRFNTCSFMYLISYDLSIKDRSGAWLKFQKHNCQGIYQSHVMKLGVSKLHFTLDDFVEIYFQMLSKEGLAEASKLTHKSKRRLEFPLNDVELYGPSHFQHGRLFEKPVLAAAEIMWKIPNFFQLRKAVVTNINSPVFEFGSDTWLLQLYPNGSEQTSGRISLVLNRLFTSVIKQHIICYFSIRDSTNTITRCRLEEVFEGSSKSVPVHLELSKIMNKSEKNVPDGILTIFCQIYVMRGNGDIEYPEPVTNNPLNVMNQFQYGFLLQQSFSAVTEITWKIPYLHAFESDSNYINSPAFNLANETWLLQLYPNGYETSVENISLILVRLFPSDINHHVICTFSVKNLSKVIDGKASCESTFKDKIQKSSPVHLKKIKNVKKQDNNPNDLLTVFCQMYVIEDKKAVLQTFPEPMQSKEIEILPLDNMKQLIHGTLVQQLFLAAAEVIWKIPDFLRLIKKQDEFNCPVFSLANDTWLLRLYLKGNKRSAKKIYCNLIRSSDSDLEHHVLWKISIKNDKNVVIESGTCENNFRKKITNSYPIHFEASKIMDNVRENMPHDVLMLICHMYIIDDNRETVIKASSQTNQTKSMTKENSYVEDIVIPKENENNTNFSQEFQNNSQDLTSEGEGNVLEKEKYIKTDELVSTLVKKKNISINQIEAEHLLPESKNGRNLENDDLCSGDIVVSKGNENKCHPLEGFQNNSEDLVSKEEGNVFDNEKDFGVYSEELDFTSPKKKKENVINQLDMEHSTPKKENEGNAAKDENMCTGDMVVSKDNENKSHFFEGFQTNSQDSDSKEGNALENIKDFDIYLEELDFTRVKEKKKKKNVVMELFEEVYHLPENDKERNIERNKDLYEDKMGVFKENESKLHCLEGFRNDSQDLVMKERENILEDGKDLDEKKNLSINQIETESRLLEHGSNFNDQ